MSDNKERKIFEDFQEVDCNECERWWTNQCDGAKTHGKGSNLRCTSFLATRNVVIPEQIKSLQRENTRIIVCIILLAVGLLAHCLGHILGG